MKSLQNSAASIFITAVAILTIVSTLGVWDIFGKDVINKSFQTLGLLIFVVIIVMVAGRFLENRSQAGVAEMPEIPNPIFKSIRNVTLAILIVSVSLLALLGVLAIWEVIEDKEVLYKALGSLSIFGFGAFVIVMTCLDREGKLGKPSEQHKNLSIARIIGLLFLAYLLFAFSRSFWY